MNRDERVRSMAGASATGTPTVFVRAGVPFLPVQAVPMRGLWVPGVRFLKEILCSLWISKAHRCAHRTGLQPDQAPSTGGAAATFAVADCFLATAGFVRRLVRTAFCAESERSAAVRFLALARACLESAADDTIRWPSPCSFFFIPRERAGFGACAGCFPRSMSRAAWCRVCAEVVPFRGGGSFTPARLALESPMAMACSVERAPCFPSRMCSISSRTNSPACVDTDLP